MINIRAYCQTLQVSRRHVPTLLPVPSSVTLSHIFLLPTSNDSTIERRYDEGERDLLLQKLASSLLGLSVIIRSRDTTVSNQALL